MPKKNKWIHDRIIALLDNDKELTTGQIKEGLWNAKTKRGTPVKKGMPSTNQLQMLLRIHYEKAGFCNEVDQTLWRLKEC